MKRVCSRLGVLAAMTILAHAPSAAATVMRYLSLEEHLGLSELVVRAKVGAAKTFVGEGGLPFTDTELEVLEVLKGEMPAGKTLLVRQLRGEARGHYRAVPGDADLEAGEEVILFLHGLEGEVAYLTALGQSKYVVERPVGPPSPGGEGALVTRDLSKSVFYHGNRGRKTAPGFAEAPVDLKLFRETLKAFEGDAR